jgi:S1-C subfamily serine protease
MAAKLGSYAYDGIEVDGLFTGNEIRVVKVHDESPGAKAGIQVGDVLAAMNGKDMSAMDKETFWKVMKHTAIGDEVTYAVVRDGHKTKVNVTMAQLPREIASKKIGYHLLAGHAQVGDAKVASH